MKPANYRDLSGMRFSHLTVIGRSPDRGDKRVRWTCICDCGKTSEVLTYALTHGETKSCGCIRKPVTAITHGGANERLYTVWADIKRRCSNKNCKEYPWYGGRGISICEEWSSDYASFRHWALSNGYDKTAPRGVCTIDRVDNDGPYSPDNCRIVSHKMQCLNRRSTVFVTINGITKSQSDWAKELNISHSSISQAKRRGTPPDVYIARKFSVRSEQLDQRRTHKSL